MLLCVTISCINLSVSRISGTNSNFCVIDPTELMKQNVPAFITLFYQHSRRQFSYINDNLISIVGFSQHVRPLSDSETVF